MKIVDPDTGASLPRNQPGEICIRGSQIMKGTNEFFGLASPAFLPIRAITVHALAPVYTAISRLEANSMFLGES